MKDLVILGSGTAGTMVANHAVKSLPGDWRTTVVDPEVHHLYQPGLLFLPFGARDEARMLKKRKATLKKGVHWVRDSVEVIDTESKKVALTGGDALAYDLLVVASGSQLLVQVYRVWQRLG